VRSAHEDAKIHRNTVTIERIDEEFRETIVRERGAAGATGG